MRLTNKDLEALRLLMRAEIKDELTILKDELVRRFDRVDTMMDGLYRDNERREQEYLFARDQLGALEKRVTLIEKRS